MEILRKYGAAATIVFPLVERDSNDLKASITFAAGDILISKDEGAFANATNTPTDEGNGMYSLALTATEMQAARIMLLLKDQTAPKVWEDQAIIIATYGNASAQHEFDLDTASVAQTGDSFARLGAPAGASVSADIAAIEAQTDDIGAAGAGLTAVPWNPAWDAEVESEVADALAVYDPPTHAELVAEIDVVQAEHVTIQADLDNMQTRLPAALVSGRMDSDVGAIQNNAITAASIATGALTAAKFAAGAFDAIFTRALSDVEGSAGFRTLAGAIAKLVNRVRLSGSTLTVYKTDDTTALGTQTATTDASAEPVVEVNTD